MIKILIIFFVGFICLVCFAAHPHCGRALPTDNADFCDSFKMVAECHCNSAGYPNGLCTNMSNLYHLMILAYWSQKSACKHQTDTSVRECMDAWNCYRLGGKDSRGRLCGLSGKACQT